jgi:hypothetical protein
MRIALGYKPHQWHVLQPSTFIDHFARLLPGCIQNNKQRLSALLLALLCHLFESQAFLAGKQ